MLSRRSVRIKAMQLLFSVNRDSQLSNEEAKKRYWDSIEDTWCLYLMNLHIIMHVTERARADYERRRQKRLPTAEDKEFTDKLYNNSLILNLVNNSNLQKEIRSAGFAEGINAEYYQNIYSEFAKGEAYQKYLKQKHTNNRDHLDIMLELYRFCRQNELFNEMLEDQIGIWHDDKSVVIGAVKKTLKALPNEDEQFFYEHKNSDKPVKDFGFELMTKTLDTEPALLKRIEPTINNWDTERVAIVDMLLLKMALCEMLGFASIPTKVTINEYVEIAKNYSTAKSKEFINGVLDKLMKDCMTEGLINKTGRGLEG